RRSYQDHGSYADDHTDQSQKCAQLVRSNRLESDPEGLRVKAVTSFHAVVCITRNPVKSSAGARYNFAGAVRIKRRRSFGYCGVLAVLAGTISLGAQVAPAVRPTDKPFLWRIDGTPPSYLFGTVHVPDARVLELPDVVRRAFDASDVFNAEIPLDDATQASMMGKIMLPPGQDLRKLIGEDVFARLVRVVEKSLNGKVPPGTATVFTTMLSPMKPWAAMS